MIAMVAAALPAAVTEFHQHFVVLRFEDEFLRRADPVGRAAPVALPAHERGRRQLLHAHLKDGRIVEEAEDRLAAGVGVHLHIGRPPRLDAFLSGDGAINPFRRSGDADAMDEVGGHVFFRNKQTNSSFRLIRQDQSLPNLFVNLGRLQTLRPLLQTLVSQYRSSSREEREL